MFNKDFYPTPPEVIEYMNLDIHDKIVLEPSAGSGNIIDWLKSNGAREVISCEKNSDLAEIVKSKSDKFLKYDFLEVTPDEVSHIHAIIMNPPFSAGVKHVLHAWQIAPAGCEIVSLINNESLENDYSRERRELKTIIENYGHSANLGDVFTTAERKTGVEIGLIKILKPGEGEREWEGFFMDEDQEPQGNGIMEFNVVREIVQRYINCVKTFEEIELLAGKLNTSAGPIRCGEIVCKMGSRDEEITTKDAYKKQLQKNAWRYLFHKLNIDKYVTSGVMKDINKFVEDQTKIPFTMKNVYRMFEVIVGTREQSFNRSLVEAVDKFTQHTHENRYAVEGWKTNSGHLLNLKIIVPNVVSKGWNDYLSPVWGHGGCYSEKIEDLVKIICSIEGENYDHLPRLRDFCRDVKMQPNEWYSWNFKRRIRDTDEYDTWPGFFEIKGFLKGTLHLKFKNRDVWARLNQRYAKIKGEVLPEKI